MKPTEEQEAIVQSSSDFLRVHGFAGAAKTSTLVMYATARPRHKMLYLAFNKGIQLEAKARFPSNVKAVTSHGLAFPQFGSRYDAAGKLTPRLRVNEVVAALGLGAYPEDFRLYVADTALKTVDRFLASGAPVIHEQLCDGLITPESGIMAGDVVALAEKLWAKMCDLKDGSIGMVHDGYLKLYQLSAPDLRYDSILFDEAQDANPVTAAIVEAQSARKVVVGDTHQQLYSFRGATNAMRKFNATETLYLTRSFRFGQGIADVANLILLNFKSEHRRIIGTDAPAHIGAIARNAPCTVIARANATLFEEAAQAMTQGKKIAFVGGIQGYRVSDTLDAYNLWSGNKERILSPYLKSFKQFDRMDEYAGAVNDKELKSLINLVKRHGSKLPRMVSQIRGACVEDAKEANIILTTAHKSKGLEWDNVRLTDDYLDMLDDKGQIRKIDFTEQEEANIAYVVASRAKKCLSPFPDLASLVAQEKAKTRTQMMPQWAQPVDKSPVKVAARP